MPHSLPLPSLLLLTLSAISYADPQSGAEDDGARGWGHSSHGSSYDEGPRQRPWRMEGIGSTTLEITTSVPEVQAWFDQGLTLLHGFWYYEAERSFRWCLKLDPDCAMAHWGMYLATGHGDFPGREPRDAPFLERALELKSNVSPREQAFIEVSEAFEKAKQAAEERGAPSEGGRGQRSATDLALDEAMVALDRMLMDYPEEVEAKALYWLLAGRALREVGDRARYGLEAVLEDVLDEEPDHVGALHYRIHNWDGKQGHYAIESCMRLGDIAPGCGHLLHMPGHVLSGIGLWHEAAIAMDRATRVEKAYMHDRVIVPEDNWDYMHNLNYLCYIQEQLGMVDQALLGAEQMLLAPAGAKDTFFNTLSKLPTMRALVKFERWEDVLDPTRIPWNRSSEAERVMAAYAELRAHIGLSHVAEAEELMAEFEGMLAEESSAASGSAGGAPDPSSFMVRRIKRDFRENIAELQGLLALAKGDALEGLGLLADAAEHQEEHWENDPPMQPTFLYNRLGDAYLELGAASLAVECYERTLETVFHDGFALAGLVVAQHRLGHDEEATDAMSKLNVVWSEADDNRWMDAARATGVRAEPWLDAPIEQRNYRREVLAVHGPSLWTRPLAPELSALDAQGETVTLADYAGQNVLAIFYLGDECLHCMEQIAVAQERMDVLTELNTVVLAISKDEVEEIAEQAPDFDLTLLSDPSFESARRFRSFDDFEEIELHSTFLIDREGRVHWSRIGGDPFTDFDFLQSELARLNGDLSGTNPRPGVTSAAGPSAGAGSTGAR